MNVRFLLLRHAEAEGNAAGQTQGRIDHPLTERGRRQAQAAAGALGHYRPVALYCSPATRARQTAAAVGAPLGLEAAVDERLHELDHGDLDGQTIAEIRDEYADFIERWRDGDIGDLRFPGGETMREAQTRMLAALDEIAARHGSADGFTEVAVVSHNLAEGAARARDRRAAGGARRFELGLASLTVAERRPGEDGEPTGWSVVTLNDRCHSAGTSSAARARDRRAAGGREALRAGLGVAHGGGAAAGRGRRADGLALANGRRSVVTLNDRCHLSGDE